MSHSFGESYRVGSTKGIHALTVFCSWDYKVTQKRASRVQQDSICTQLKVSSYQSHACCLVSADLILSGASSQICVEVVYDCELALRFWAVVVFP
jgi:hypothetical protein